MSDYYGDATLEDWLAKEVFKVETVPPEVVSVFESNRKEVETDIERWMDSDDGNGNPLSWHAWGRGRSNIPDEDVLFDLKCLYGFVFMTRTPSRVVVTALIIKHGDKEGFDELLEIQRKWMTKVNPVTKSVLVDIFLNKLTEIIKRYSEVYDKNSKPL